MKERGKDEVRTLVRRYYGSIADRSNMRCGCQPSSYCSDEPQPPRLVQEAEELDYTRGDTRDISDHSNSGFGCGNPTIIAGLKPGEKVLDLGSGAGFDCLLAAERVGEHGYVIGIDMTPEMIEQARKNAAKGSYANVEFRLGEIEHLPVKSNSVDVIISNCVINLSPEKAAVFKEAFRVLKPGGRMAISDIVATAELPQEMRENEAFICGCIGGAATFGELEQYLIGAGFQNVRITPDEKSRESIRTWAPGVNVEQYLVSAYIEATKPALAERTGIAVRQA